MSKGMIWKQNILPWIVCFSASLFFAYELLQLHVMNAISPMLIKDLGLSATDFGYLSSTYLLADVIFLLPAGMLLDRFSVRKVMLTALFLCLIGTAGFAKSTSLGMAASCHFLSGIGNAFCFLSCIMLISRWFPKERQAFMVGLMITIGMLGGVVAQLPFSLLAQSLNWRAALMIDASIGVLLFAVIFAFVKDAPKKFAKKKEASIPFFEGLKRSVLNLHNICCGLYTCFMNLPLMVISAVWGTLFLTQVHHLSIATSSFIVSMICMGTIVGSPIYGWISDRIHRRKTLMVFGGVISIITFVCILLVRFPSEGMLTFLFFSLGFFTSSQTLGYPAITEHNPKELTGTSMGIAALIIMGIPALIQPLSGKLLDMSWDGTMSNGAPLYSASDFQTAFLIFPIGFLISLFALLKIKESPKKELALAI
ncbi:MAG: MFS transporter [Simkaniaceae bacterium]|nr:MFS transporter [Simkaniaceae bacterium]